MPKKSFTPCKEKCKGGSKVKSCSKKDKCQTRRSSRTNRCKMPRRCLTPKKIAKTATKKPAKKTATKKPAKKTATKKPAKNTMKISAIPMKISAKVSSKCKYYLKNSKGKCMSKKDFMTLMKKAKEHAIQRRVVNKMKSYKPKKTANKTPKKTAKKTAKKPAKKPKTGKGCTYMRDMKTGKCISQVEYTRRRKNAAKKIQKFVRSKSR